MSIYNWVVKSRLQIDIGTYLSVPKLNLKDRKVAIDASCACKKKKRSQRHLCRKR